MIHLVDKSAIEQARRNPTARETLLGLSASDEVATCATVALEVLYSARSADDYASQKSVLENFVWLSTDDSVALAALEIQARLAAKGQHRRSIPDLLVAATALIHDATVLHYDKDFDLIAEVTGQAARWIIPRGSDKKRNSK